MSSFYQHIINDMSIRSILSETYANPLEDFPNSIVDQNFIDFSNDIIYFILN